MQPLDLTAGSARPAPEAALRALAAGDLIVITDESDERCEAFVAVAAEHATAEVLGRMARTAGGWMGLALTSERFAELGLGLAPLATIDAGADLTGGGGSVGDRAHTIQVALDPARGADDVTTPGHVTAVRTRPGGVLGRAAHAEAAVDLAREAGCAPAALLSVLEDEAGGPVDAADVRAWARRHGAPIVGLAEVIAHRRRTERIVEPAVRTRMPTRFGAFEAVGYRSVLDGLEHVALVKGHLSGPEPVLVRVHSECLVGDAFHGLRCDCGRLLERSLEAIEREGRGVLVYLAQPAKGLGWLGAPGAEDGDLDRGVPEPVRNVGVGAGILTDLGLHAIRLLTDHPHQLPALDGYGLTVEGQVALGA